MLILRKWKDEEAWIHVESNCPSRRQETNFVGKIVEIEEDVVWIESYCGNLGVRLSIGLDGASLSYSDPREALPEHQTQIQQLAVSGIIIDSECGESVFIVELTSEDAVRAFPTRPSLA